MLACAGQLGRQAPSCGSPTQPSRLQPAGIRWSAAFRRRRRRLSLPSAASGERAPSSRRRAWAWSRLLPPHPRVCAAQCMRPPTSRSPLKSATLAPTHTRQCSPRPALHRSLQRVALPASSTAATCLCLHGTPFPARLTPAAHRLLACMPSSCLQACPSACGPPPTPPQALSGTPSCSTRAAHPWMPPLHQLRGGGRLPADGTAQPRGTGGCSSSHQPGLQG